MTLHAKTIIDNPTSRTELGRETISSTIDHALREHDSMPEDQTASNDQIISGDEVILEHQVVPEDDVIPPDAEFAVFFPEKRSPNTSDCQISSDLVENWSQPPDHTVKGFYFNSQDAEEWIDENSNLPVTHYLREEGACGPLATMLDAHQSALTLFSDFTPRVLKLSQNLADTSGFPVMVQPIVAYPMFGTFQDTRLIFF
ncbi:hypothetical protein DL96DRAFT_1192674 [Flagelloscypha sp. PMI_526]|nr:hypothetical protein DL96DRAFT_1192674 [Flagelloscypha sp. PMI_526]